MAEQRLFTLVLPGDEIEFPLRMPAAYPPDYDPKYDKLRPSGA
jgi:hypothetical protein